VTFRSHKKNQYWSAKRAVLVTLRTSTGNYHQPVLVGRVTSTGSHHPPIEQSPQTLYNIYLTIEEHTNLPFNIRSGDV